MNILKSKPTEDTSLDALIEERAEVLAALKALEMQDVVDREKAGLAGLSMAYTEAGASPEGASAVERGIYISDESAHLASERFAADARRRRRAPELAAASANLRRVDSAIRHHLDARLVVAAEPQRRAVETALTEAFAALDVLDDRRNALSQESGVTLIPSAFETAARQALTSAAAVVGMPAPEPMASRQGRSNFLEIAGAAKKRDRRLADLQDELLRPPKVIESLTRQGDVARQKEREAAGERRQEEATRVRLTTLPKDEQERRRKLREQIAETEKGSNK